MRATKNIAEDICAIEGFEVVFTSPDGADVSNRRVDDYPYQRAARATWTVSQWKQERFAATYPDFGVDVFDPEGNLVHGKTLLSSLRQRYIDADDSEGSDAPEDDGEDTVVDADPIPPSQPRGAATQQDIESWLWEAANILRGPVGPANLRDFVFPMLFLKRLSDTWDEERNKAVAEWGDTPSLHVNLLKSRKR